MTMPDDDWLALDLLIRGFEVSRVLRAVADIGLADHLPADATLDTHDLAQRTGVQHEPLLRMIRLLASLGVFRLAPGGGVSHTPRSLFLRSDTPRSLHLSARFWAAPGSWRAWEHLDAALHAEQPHQAAWGQDRFSYMRGHADEARVFDSFMAHFPDDRHRAIAAAYDFSGAGRIVDIGGGNGECLRQILSRSPEPRGLIFDREDVVAAIPAAALLDGRIDTRGGDFRSDVPDGCDTYVLIKVLHDWADEDAVAILRTCRKAMSPSARLLIGEILIDPDPSTAPPINYLIDLQMMAMFGRARERTADEFAGLLQQAGFALNRVVATDSAVSIVEATVAGE